MELIYLNPKLKSLKPDDKGEFNFKVKEQFSLCTLPNPLLHVYFHLRHFNEKDNY